MTLVVNVIRLFLNYCRGGQINPKKPFQSSLIFASKAELQGAYPRVAPLSCSTTGYPPCLTHKHSARIEKPARHKHSSLLAPFVSSEENEVLWIRPLFFVVVVVNVVLVAVVVDVVVVDVVNDVISGPEVGGLSGRIESVTIS